MVGVALLLVIRHGWDGFMTPWLLLSSGPSRCQAGDAIEGHRNGEPSCRELGRQGGILASGIGRLNRHRIQHCARRGGRRLAGVVLIAGSRCRRRMCRQRGCRFVGCHREVHSRRWRRAWFDRSLAPLRTQFSGAKPSPPSGTSGINSDPIAAAEMWRAGLTMFAACALLAALTRRRQDRMSGSQRTVYGVLLGCFGHRNAVLGRTWPAANTGAGGRLVAWKARRIECTSPILGLMIRGCCTHGRHPAVAERVVTVDCRAAGWLVFISLVRRPRCRH
jgi:hypothetical protein